MYALREDGLATGSMAPKLSDEQHVRRATSADITSLARVLGRAFVDDPFYDWLVRRNGEADHGAREQRLLHTFDVMLRRMSADLNETYTPSDLSGAALWKRPAEYKLSLPLQLRLLPAFARAMGWLRIPTFLNLLEHLEALHDRWVPEPHFYLFVLGVEPARQRSGLGGQLLGPVLARCDARQKRAYLETTKADNLPFYARHGFEVVHVVEDARWPTFWSMRREPVTPG
jgi:ribosomal protein S18 acetylase RimI-like enzyme